MKIERVFNNNNKVTFQDILTSLMNETIDSLLSIHYSQDKVNTTASHIEGKEFS